MALRSLTCPIVLWYAMVIAPLLEYSLSLNCFLPGFCWSQAYENSWTFDRFAFYRRTSFRPKRNHA
jgi:hypothetical protein